MKRTYFTLIALLLASAGIQVTLNALNTEPEHIVLPYFAPVNQGRMDRNAPVEPGKCCWGQLVVQNNSGTAEFRDAKVWVGINGAQAKTWDWSITNTHHRPGIQTDEIQEFIDQVDEVVLTRGVDSVLQVSQETIDWVKSKGKTCHVGKTPEMIELYNKLVQQGKKVGGLFHSTC